eukprot:5347181-Amphidinium_carterae.1
MADVGRTANISKVASGMRSSNQPDTIEEVMGAAQNSSANATVSLWLVCPAERSGPSMHCCTSPVIESWVRCRVTRMISAASGTYMLK